MALNLPPSNRTPGDSGHADDTNLMSFNPSVAFSISNVQNSNVADAILKAEIHCRSRIGTDCDYLFSGKAPVPRPSFCSHVGHIFSLSALPKMVWVYASRGITVMKNFARLINRPDESAIHPSVDKPTMSCCSVPLGIFCSHPKPAGIGDHDRGKNLVIGNFVPGSRSSFWSHGSTLTSLWNGIKQERQLAWL